MSITASLAASQLRKKRARSFATILAIILSTALTTTVSSFVASGNAMLKETMGEDYAGYGQAYFSMLLIPGILMGILIVAMSIIVISNVFRVSAGERIAQFGTLKCVGATKKQIVETVMYESLFLSVIGVPCGLGLGLVFTYLGIKVANHYFDDLNALVHMMMNKITFSLQFVVSWKALLISVVISILTIIFSAYRPAKKAAGISAIDCIRKGGNVTVAEKKHRVKKLKRSGIIEKELASVNVSRNRRNTRASVVTLSISMILFISLSGMRSLAKGVEDYMYAMEKQNVLVEYISNYEECTNSVTGRRERTFTKPMDSELGEQITNELKAYDANDFFAVGDDLSTYFVVLPQDALTADMEEAQEYLQGEKQKDYEFQVQIIVPDAENYQKICEKAGVEPGANVLLNYYSYNHRGNEEKIVPFSESLHTLNLETADGTVTEVEIGGMLEDKEIPSELKMPGNNPVCLVMQKAQVRGYSWMSSPADEEGYMEYANQVMERYFPGGNEGNYMEMGFNARVYKTHDYVKIMNVAIVLASVFLYSFVVLVALIGAINVISTMSTNVQVRAREFAVLQSIGMTSADLQKMLNTESILCARKALLIGLPIGLIIILVMNVSVRMMFPIAYCIPWKEILLVIALVFLLIWGTIRMTAKKLRNQNIIETIRGQE